MNIFFYISLFIFGSLFGSFASVIIYRLKSGESGILTGRSHCPKCNHILGAMELIPIFSWLKNFGKCKYCKAKISSIYPFLEISTGILFALIGYFLVDFNLILSGNLLEFIKLFFWLVVGFITIIYSFYDILFLEINDKVMAFGIIFILFFVLLEIFGITNIFSYLGDIDYYKALKENLIGFGILIFSIIGYYIIIFKELEFKYDFLILTLIFLLIFGFLKYFDLGILDNLSINLSIGIFIIFIFLFLQIAVSGGAWMGGGDLRIAIFMGLLLGYSFAIEGLFFTYIIGSIISILVVIISKFKNGFKTTFNSQIPFGPFLALGTFAILFYQKTLNEILNFYL